MSEKCYDNLRLSDASFWYLDNLKAQVVAESGKATDRFHLGKILLRCFKDAPDFICQIDGATGECETNSSVLTRSVRCAISMKKAGLQLGDVVVYMAPNHIHLAIPLFAAFYLGLIIAPVDRTLTGDDLLKALQLRRPKMIFCQGECVPEIEKACKALHLLCKIVTFDEYEGCHSFPKFIGSSEGVDINAFKASDLDPDETIAYILPTSGTTGIPKAAAETHKTLSYKLSYSWLRSRKFPSPGCMTFLLSPLQWLTAMSIYVSSVIYRNTRVQSSQPLTVERFYYIINTYKPTTMVVSPTMLLTLLDNNDCMEKCDFSCFETICVGGAPVSTKLAEKIEKAVPKGVYINIYGLTETGLVTLGYWSIGSCGPVIPGLEYKLINIYTEEEVREAYVHGELWLRGPSLFKEYFKNPVETKNAFAEGGWFKTGDIFYRDEHDHMYFVERIKLLLKHYTNKIMYDISPVELENVIKRLPGVYDVAVAGIPDPAVGDLPVACVVRRHGYDVTVEDVKNIVRDSLPFPKHLRGGVIFAEQLPVTSSSKLDRKKLNKMVLQMERN